MRFVLVVLFLVALHLAHRPSPPAIPERPIAQDTIARDITSQPPSSIPLRTPHAAGSNLPATTGAANVPPMETADTAIEQPASRTSETERPGEQRTSQRGALKPADIETDMQKELIRLACLGGRPEKGWGSRSRSALRRFVARAKPRDASAPSEALLRAMRGFPANYCKLCNPGQAACKTRPAPQKKSDIETPLARKQPVPEAAYLPPWMLQDDGRVVTATEDDAAAEAAEMAKVRREVRADIVAHAPPAATPPASERQNRRKRIVRRSRPPRFRKLRGFSLPTFNGWPRRY